MGILSYTPANPKMTNQQKKLVTFQRVSPDIR